MVRLFRRIQYWLSSDRADPVFYRLLELRRNPKRHAAEIGLVASGSKRSTELPRPADTLTPPPHRFLLDLGRQLRPLHRRQLRIQPRHNQLSHHSDVGRRRIHQSEIVRAWHMKTF